MRITLKKGRAWVFIQTHRVPFKISRINKIAWRGLTAFSLTPHWVGESDPPTDPRRMTRIYYRDWRFNITLFWRSISIILTRRIELPRGWSGGIHLGMDTELNDTDKHAHFEAWQKHMKEQYG